MSKSTIEREWAWAQIEAMADGTLEGDDLARMQRALSEDAELVAALDAARAVLGDLRRTAVPKPPARLLWRLLVQRDFRQGRRRDAVRHSPPGRNRFVAPIGVAATALIAFLFGSMLEHGRSQREQEAARELAIAMGYLRQTAVITSEEVGQQVGHGLLTALEKSRETLANEGRADDEQNGG